MDVSLLPILVFVAVYILISFELLNKAVAALLGVMFLLVNSLKFAHQAVSQQHIFKREIEKSREHLTYQQASFSHDMVAFDWIDHVITEQGEVSRQF